MICAVLKGKVAFKERKKKSLAGSDAMPGNSEKFLTKFAKISAVAFSVLPHIP